MSDIEVGAASLLKWILCREPIKTELRRSRRSHINRMRPCIGNDSLQTSRKPPLKLDLHRVVIGRAAVCGHLKLSKVTVRIDKILRNEQIPSESPDVGYGHGLGTAKRLLSGRIPLIGVRELQVRIGHAKNLAKWR